MLIEQSEDGEPVMQQEPCKSKAIVAYMSGVNSEKLAVKIFVGAGARLLFYPTLFYNVVRNKFESEFRWWDQIEQFLFLGAVPFPKDVFRLKDLGVEAVITLNEPYETLVSASMYQSQRIKHLVIPTQDYLFAPSFEDIQLAVDFIHENVQQRKSTYVHCKAGRGRSTTIVLCYLVKYRGMTPYDAFYYVRSKRPRVLLAASQWKAVKMYSEHQYCRNISESPFFSAPQPWPLFGSLAAHEDGIRMCNQDKKCSCCEELPVIVNLSDLEGYNGIQDAGIIGNDTRKELRVAYKVRLMAARSVIGVARASAALARLSCLWLGCHAGDQAFKLSLTCGALSDSGTQASIDFQSVAHSPVASHMNLHVCQQGLVEC